MTTPWRPIGRIDAALTAFRRRHGRNAKVDDLRGPQARAAGLPGYESVRTHRGGLPQATAHAGLPPTKRGRPVEWPPERVVDAMIAFYLEHHRWPTKRDWRSAGTAHPAYQTLVRLPGGVTAIRRKAAEELLSRTARRHATTERA